MTHPVNNNKPPNLHAPNLHNQPPVSSNDNSKSHYPQPFPGSFHLTNKQLKMFWSSFLRQIATTMNHEMQRMKAALKKLKD